MKLRLIPDDFSILQLTSFADIDLACPFVFTAVTDEEYSLVMPTRLKPQDYVSCEDGWVMLGMTGVLDFSLIGILAPIATLLAQKQIGIFVVSTYNTDYILIKKARLKDALAALQDEGYDIER